MASQRTGPQRDRGASEKRKTSQERDEEGGEYEARDDAIDVLLPPSYEESISTTMLNNPSVASKIRPLPYPIVLPQCRPRSSSRGFIIAYAPILGTHKNITQDQFVTFIRDFTSSTQVSPVFHAINIGAMAAGFAPSAIAMAVSMSVQASVRFAMAAQVKGRTNSFLDKSNRELFWPVGLHAMITAFLPGQGQEVDVDSSRINGSGSGQSVKIPQSAPLILVPDADSDDDGPEKSSWRKSSKFASNYFDKRAQASHPDIYASTLGIASSGEHKPKFASRYADPNHPVNSGSPLSLLTGGIVNPRGWKEGRDGGGLLARVQEFKQRSEGAGQGRFLDRVDSFSSRSSMSTYPKEGQFNHPMRPTGQQSRSERTIQQIQQPGGLKQMVRKATKMQQDVLYLVIAEIPDDVMARMGPQP
jgi:hypothetical protein